MLTLNNPFWSKDQNDLFKVIIWNDFFRNEFGRNLDMVPKLSIAEKIGHFLASNWCLLQLQPIGKYFLSPVVQKFPQIIIFKLGFQCRIAEKIGHFLASNWCLLQLQPIGKYFLSPVVQKFPQIIIFKLGFQCRIAEKIGHFLASNWCLLQLQPIGKCFLSPVVQKFPQIIIFKLGLETNINVMEGWVRQIFFIFKMVFGCGKLATYFF